MQLLKIKDHLPGTRQKLKKKGGLQFYCCSSYNTNSPKFVRHASCALNLISF